MKNILEKFRNWLRIVKLWICIIAFPAIADFFKSCKSTISKWWHRNDTQNNTAENNRCFHIVLHNYNHGIGIFRILFGGLILYISINSFYPGFAEEFPILYSIFHGCSQLLEFMVSWGIRAINGILKGKAFTQVPELFDELVNLWHQFMNWFMSL